MISQVSEEDMSGMVLESMGLNQEDMTAFGISMSLMNVQAYGIAAVMPAEGREEAVKEAFGRCPELEVVEITYQGEWVSVTARRK